MTSTEMTKAERVARRADMQAQAEAKMMEIYGFVVTSKTFVETLPDGSTRKQSLTLVDGRDTATPSGTGKARTTGRRHLPSGQRPVRRAAHAGRDRRYDASLPPA